MENILVWQTGESHVTGSEVLKMVDLPVHKKLLSQLFLNTKGKLKHTPCYYVLFFFFTTFSDTFRDEMNINVFCLVQSDWYIPPYFFFTGRYI